MSGSVPSKRASLAEVAEAAGVSISTVSKVANGSADVADRTRVHVEKILKERGYVATRNRRRSLVPVTLMAHDMTSPDTLDVVRGAVRAAGETGVDLSLATFPQDLEDPRWIDELRAEGRKGAVVITSSFGEVQRARFRSNRMPLVVIDPLSAPDPGTYSVGSTDWAGGLEATEYLVGLGHRDIVMLGGRLDTKASRARVSGHVAGRAGASLDPDGARVLGGDFTYASGLESGIQLLSEPRPPTAIFAASDVQALGVLEAARRAGIRVPEDLTVVGYGDLVIARSSAPLLTTIRQPFDQMGAEAIEQVAELMSGSTTRPLHTELATHLMVRESSGPPRST